MTPDHAALDRIYMRLPRLDCQRKCQATCGPVPFLPIEWDRTVAAVGAEAMQPTAAARQSLVCPLLVNGLCSAYHVRPVICRLFGLVKAMRCPWGCRPSRWLSDKEANQIMRAITALQPGEPRSPYEGLNAALYAIKNARRLEAL